MASLLHDQLGRTVIVYLARPADTYALVPKVCVIVVNRECPFIVAASGSCVARATSDPSLVSYRHVGGYRRPPGNLALHITRSVGECRMSLWSAVVVSIYVYRLAGVSIQVCLPVGIAR